MNSTEQQIQEIEIEIKEAEQRIEMMERVQRLIDSEDWKVVITEEYLKSEPMRIAFLRADATQQDPDKQQMWLKMLDSVGYFRQYLQGILAMGREAQRSLREKKETHVQIMEEKDLSEVA